MAFAHWLAGRGDDSARAAERAHQASIRAGQPARAARQAWHLGMAFAQRGEWAQAGGWFARAGRVLDAAGIDPVERGYLIVPQAIATLDGGDATGALAMFEQVSEIAERFRDPDLTTLGRLGRGQSLIADGEVERGVALLDDAMLAVTADEVSPIVVGIVYCASIEAFQAVFDVRRAQEWTTALGRWCDSQPEMVPFRGRCLAYRSELLRIHGRWQDAAAEARRAHDWLARPPIEPALGEAHYQQAEVYRLQGEFGQAEAAYREGSKWGRRPDPGLALLRLGQGQVEVAAAAIRRALDEADGLGRVRLLLSFVEIVLAQGDVPAARAAADELAAIAARTGAALLRANAEHADGLVRYAEGDVRGALGSLRRAFQLWQELDAPYDAARARVGIALACRSLGDEDAASLELDAARDVFGSLQARPDLARLEAMAGARPPTPGGLSRREVEVLRLLAGGATNREIAAGLGISERTVDRHVSNIYAKLDVSSRSAATAFAYEHGLS